MIEQHPITPPPELVQKWWTEFERTEPDTDSLVFIATQAARWGADQELEACCEWLRILNNKPMESLIGPGQQTIDRLRAARRPKPPSLKEQALEALDDAVLRGDCITISDALPTIRRALEALDD